MSLDMKYNSQREHLIIPEYGRNVQNLINHAKKMENDEERQVFVEKVVQLMLQLNPHNKNLDDVKEKIWLHVFRIADFDIEVMPPDGIKPEPHPLRKQPEIVPYSDGIPKFRHYGNNVQRLVKKARSMEDGPIKDAFVETIGNYMKLAYKTWNKEHYVSDNIILDDLSALSNGELEMHDEAELDTLTTSNRKRRASSNNRDSKPRNSSGRGGRSGGRSSSRNYRSSSNSSSRRGRGGSSSRGRRK